MSGQPRELGGNGNSFQNQCFSLAQHKLNTASYVDIFDLRIFIVNIKGRAIHLLGCRGLYQVSMPYFVFRVLYFS